MTLRHFISHRRGFENREREKYRFGMWQAWQVASLTRVKKLPQLKQALDRLEKKNVKPQSKKEIWGNIEMIHALHGGVKRKKNG